MCLEVAKTNIINKLQNILAKIRNIEIKPQSKMKLLKFMIYPKLSFEHKICDFPYTWITNELDSIVHYHLRKWFEMPISSCILEIMRLPENRGGLNLQLLKDYAEILRLSKRYTLQHSADIEIKQLWLETKQNNVIIDVLLQSDTTLKVAKSSITLTHTDKALAHVSSLAVQGILVNALIKGVNLSRIAKWMTETNHLTPTLLDGRAGGCWRCEVRPELRPDGHQSSK